MVGVHGDRHYVPCMKKSDILIWPTVVWEDRILHTYTYMAIGASCFDYTIENDLSVSSEVQQYEKVLPPERPQDTCGYVFKMFSKTLSKYRFKDFGKFWMT